MGHLGPQVRLSRQSYLGTKSLKKHSQTSVIHPCPGDMTLSVHSKDDGKDTVILLSGGLSFLTFMSMVLCNPSGRMRKGPVDTSPLFFPFCPDLPVIFLDTLSGKTWEGEVESLAL